MNAPFRPAYPGSQAEISIADLGDDDVAQAITAFVHVQGGSPFHLPAWLIAVERGTGQRARGIVATRDGKIVGWLSCRDAVYRHRWAVDSCGAGLQA